MTVSVDKVSFSYKETPILKEVSLSFDKGKFSVILGPNGCGKSTLFSIMSRIQKPQSGTVYISGTDIYDMEPRTQAKQMAVLSQVGVLPEFMSVHDMVMQGRFCYQSFLSRYSDNDIRIVENAMRQMDVLDLADCKVSELSGGQVQRCRMAMTLAQDTDIILLDEPTTHLDLKHQYAILDMGRELTHQGKTVIAILHDMAQAELYADMVAVLHNTTIYDYGTPLDVITPRMMLNVFGVDTVRIGDKKAGLHVPHHLV